MKLREAVQMMEPVIKNWEMFGMPDIQRLIPAAEPERSCYKAYWLECFKIVLEAAKNQV